MGFHATSSLSEGCSCDPQDAIADFGGDSSEIDNRHTFRIASHPAAALQDVMLEKHRSGFPPSIGRDTADRAIQQLGRLSLGETDTGHNVASHNVIYSQGPLHAGASYRHYEDVAYHGAPVNCQAWPPVVIPTDEQERASSPAPSVASTHSSSSSATSASVTRTQRARFLVFMKILFKVLAEANEHEIRDRARDIVAECTRRNRMGDPSYVPLMDAVAKRLRRFVGESYWKRASMLLRHFVSKHAGLPGKSIPQEIS